MAAEDSKVPFLRIPWTAALLDRPNLIFYVPAKRLQKAFGQDTLFAETLKTPRTFGSCISFYVKPTSYQDDVEEVHTLFMVGEGVNGHPGVMHGGIVASVLDTAMGILQTANHEWHYSTAAGKALAKGETVPTGSDYFTAELKIKYLKPVSTPAPLVCTARNIKRDGRKQWIYAEIKQKLIATEDNDGNEVVCAKADAFMIQPKPKKVKL